MLIFRFKICQIVIADGGGESQRLPIASLRYQNGKVDKIQSWGWNGRDSLRPNNCKLFSPFTAAQILHILLFHLPAVLLLALQCGSALIILYEKCQHVNHLWIWITSGTLGVSSVALTETQKKLIDWTGKTCASWMVGIWGWVALMPIPFPRQILGPDL